MALIAYVGALFRYVPWLAWPLAIAVVALVAWGIVKTTRKRAAKAAPTPKPETLDVSVPFGPDDTVDSIALKLIDAAHRRGQRVTVTEARRIAEVELRKARGGH